MQPVEPEPVKLFVGALHSDESLVEEAVEALIAEFGKIDYKSPEFPFDISDYYREEMGWPIKRRFVSFQDLINPGQIAEVKIRTNEIENALAVDRRRKVNLDPGYLDYNKVVLASAKFNSQKVYLDHGIYADPTLWFENGRYHPYPFSFPDFQSGQYNEIFAHMRALFKGRRRRLRTGLSVARAEQESLAQEYQRTFHGD